jgi:hypothetical protein
MRLKAPHGVRGRRAAAGKTPAAPRFKSALRFTRLAKAVTNRSSRFRVGSTLSESRQRLCAPRRLDRSSSSQSFVTPGDIGAQASQLVLTAAARTSPTPSPPGRRNDPRTSARSCLPGYRGASRINRVVKGSVYQRGSTWYDKFRIPGRDPSTGDYPWITKGGFDTKKRHGKPAEKRRARLIAAESTGHRPAHSL